MVGRLVGVFGRLLAQRTLFGVNKSQTGIEPPGIRASADGRLPDFPLENKPGFCGSKHSALPVQVLEEHGLLCTLTQLCFLFSEGCCTMILCANPLGSVATLRVLRKGGLHGALHSWVPRPSLSVLGKPLLVDSEHSQGYLQGLLSSAWIKLGRVQNDDSRYLTF